MSTGKGNYHFLPAPGAKSSDSSNPSEGVHVPCPTQQDLQLPAAQPDTESTKCCGTCHAIYPIPGPEDDMCSMCKVWLFGRPPRPIPMPENMELNPPIAHPMAT
eukprot:9417276-Heterocapsa_arctica.AAC.1